MHSLAFLFAAVGYVGLTFFIYFNYPRQWREDRLFISVLILWHIVGLSAVVTIFTVFKNICHENFRYEITRIGTCYYITTTVQAILFGLMHGIPFGLVTKSAAVFLLLTAISGLFGWYQGWLNESQCGGSVIPSWLLHGCMNFLTAVLSL